MVQSMTRPGFHSSPRRLCVRLCVTLCCFSDWGLIRLACLQLHDVGKWSRQCLWSLVTHTHTFTCTLLHTHTHTQEIPRPQVLKCLWIIVLSGNNLALFTHFNWGLMGHMCLLTEQTQVPWHTHLSWFDSRHTNRPIWCLLHYTAV